MFSRLRRTYHILTYKAPDDGPDLVIVPEPEVYPSKTSKSIAGLIEIGVLFCCFFVVGLIAGKIEPLLHPLWSKRPDASLVAVGTLAAFLLWLGHLIVNQIHGRIGRYLRLQMKLSERLAPYFGQRLDSTIRVLRG